MDTSIMALSGAGSALFVSVGFAIYIRNILGGKTKPEKSSRWIWTTLMIVAFAAQAASGATWSLSLTGALLLGNIVIAILSLKHGYEHFRGRDYLALLATAAGIYLWAATDNPLYALLITIAVDFLGNWLTILKSWWAPYSENVSTWVLTTIGAVLGVLAVGNFNTARLMFPIYLVFANTLTLGAICYRRRWRAQRITQGRRHKRRQAEGIS